MGWKAFLLHRSSHMNLGARSLAYQSVLKPKNRKKHKKKLLKFLLKFRLIFKQISIDFSIEF